MGGAISLNFLYCSKEQGVGVDVIREKVVICPVFRISQSAEVMTADHLKTGFGD